MNTLEFYRKNMPRGMAFVETVAWATGATPTITIDPVANEEIFIDEIGIQCDSTFELPVGKNIIFTGLFKSNGTTNFEIHTIKELKALLDGLNILTTEMAGKIKIKPPLLLTDSGLRGILTFSISHTDGVAGAITGTITFIVKGWRLTESED